MKFAITGASGEVGSALVEFLVKEKHAVVALDIAPFPVHLKFPEEYFNFKIVNLVNYEAVFEAFKGCDAVVHLGAFRNPGFGNPPSPADHIIYSVYNVLHAAAAHGIKRICQASSVNATGLRYSPELIFDQFPLSEKTKYRPCDPYSLSKEVCEVQATSFCNRHDKDDLRIASLRFHHVVPSIETNWVLPLDIEARVKDLWGYVTTESVVRACYLTIVSEGWKGHEVFCIVAPRCAIQDGVTSLELKEKYWNDTPVAEGFDWTAEKGKVAFWDSSKAEKILGWKHDSA